MSDFRRPNRKKNIEKKMKQTEHQPHEKPTLAQIHIFTFGWGGTKLAPDIRLHNMCVN